MTERRGPVRHPRNLSADATGSIHDDDTAVELGLRGGTVAGNIHLNQFVPLLVEEFGSEWFATGSLSVFFRHATTDGEPVMAVVDAAGARGQVRMETPDGVVVAEGTASVGPPDEASALRRRDLRPVGPESLRILGRLRAGMTFGPREVRPRAVRQQALLAANLITEPHDWYAGPSPWGGAIACPLIAVDLLTATERDVRALVGDAVGMYGAIELQFRGAPILIDEPHEVTSQVVALSDSPRTEILWYDATARRAGADVVTMRMMSRLMKASSTLYAD